MEIVVGLPSFPPDTRVKFGDVVFLAHKEVLAVGSKVLEVMLSEAMREKFASKSSASVDGKSKGRSEEIVVFNNGLETAESTPSSALDTAKSTPSTSPLLDIDLTNKLPLTASEVENVMRCFYHRHEILLDEKNIDGYAYAAHFLDVPAVADQVETLLLSGFDTVRSSPKRLFQTLILAQTCHYKKLLKYCLPPCAGYLKMRKSPPEEIKKEWMAMNGETLRALFYMKGEEYKVGDRVYALDLEKTWCPAEIAEVSPTAVKVHYPGYTSGWDEWLEFQRVSWHLPPSK